MTKDAMDDLVGEAKVSMLSSFHRLEEKADELEDELVYARVHRDDAIQERNALSAHMERLVETWNRLTEEGVTHVKLCDAMDEVFGEGESASLARRDATMKAEALEDFASTWDWERSPGHKDIRQRTQKYRCQAEGATP